MSTKVIEFCEQCSNPINKVFYTIKIKGYEKDNLSKEYTPSELDVEVVVCPKCAITIITKKHIN